MDQIEFDLVSKSTEIEQIATSLRSKADLVRVKNSELGLALVNVVQILETIEEQIKAIASSWNYSYEPPS